MLSRAKHLPHLTTVRRFFGRRRRPQNDARNRETHTFRPYRIHLADGRPPL